MTREESKQLFTEIREYLAENDFTCEQDENGEYSKNNYRGDYMLFNCPHICSSVRFFKVKEGEKRVLDFKKDVRTSFARPLEWNRELVFDFLPKVIEEYYG